MDARMKRFVCWAAFLCPVLLAAQDDSARKLSKRYGYTHEPSLYSQKTPQEALQSIIKALDAKKIDYLLAHLSDPKFVDDRVAEYKAFQKGSAEAKTVLAFERLARETVLHFQEDPLLIKELRQYVKDAEWEIQEATAVGTLKTASPRRVYLRKVEERWFLENRQQ